MTILKDRTRLTDLLLFCYKNLSIILSKNVFDNLTKQVYNLEQNTKEKNTNGRKNKSKKTKYENISII